jgi:hypothetical protein
MQYISIKWTETELRSAWCVLINLVMLSYFARLYLRKNLCDKEKLRKLPHSLSSHLAMGSLYLYMGTTSCVLPYLIVYHLPL